MDHLRWLLFVLATIIAWATTTLLYKTGIRDKNEEHIGLKYSVCIGIVFFVIAVVGLAIRDEPFSIWESAVRYWPMTLFGLVYPVLNTFSFKGFVYNEATVESPVEGIGAGTSTILLIFTFLVLGRASSISELLTPLKAVGILTIMVCITMLAVVRNKENQSAAQDKGSRWMTRGLGTLIFPLVYAVADSIETITTGICLDSTYGYAMPEGDSVIITGMLYALFSIGAWIYIYQKEKRPYNPFTRYSAPRLLGAVADNVGVVFYSYAMAINSTSTDPLIAAYPILVMLGGHVLMGERVSAAQYASLLGIEAGSIMVVAGTVGLG